MTAPPPFSPAPAPPPLGLTRWRTFLRQYAHRSGVVKLASFEFYVIAPGNMTEPHILHQDPRVFTLASFLSTEESEHFLQLGRPQLQDSVVTDDKGGTVRSAQRTSKTMFDLPSSIELTARQEGWIFGVDPIHVQSP